MFKQTSPSQKLPIFADPLNMHQIYKSKGRSDINAWDFNVNEGEMWYSFIINWMWRPSNSSLL